MKSNSSQDVNEFSQMIRWLVLRKKNYVQSRYSDKKLLIFAPSLSFKISKRIDMVIVHKLKGFCLDIDDQEVCK